MSANVLSSFRSHLGYSQRAFARALGVSHAVIANLETERTLITVVNLDEILEPLSIDGWAVIDGDYIPGAVHEYGAREFEEDLARPLTEDQLEAKLATPIAVLNAVIEMARAESDASDQRNQLRGLKEAARAAITAVGTSALNQRLGTQKTVSPKCSFTVPLARYSQRLAKPWRPGRAALV